METLYLLAAALFALTVGLAVAEPERDTPADVLLSLLLALWAVTLVGVFALGAVLWCTQHLVGRPAQRRVQP